MQKLKRTNLKILFFIVAFCTVPYFSYLKSNRYMIIGRRRKKKEDETLVLAFMGF